MFPDGTGDRADCNSRIPPGAGHKFPTGLMDCYAVARALYMHPDTKPEDITLIGDSAGGNLAFALSIITRDRGEFMPKRQILIYPAVNNDYSEKSLFSSVRENGQDYLLTAGKLKIISIFMQVRKRTS